VGPEEHLGLAHSELSVVLSFQGYDEDEAWALAAEKPMSVVVFPFTEIELGREAEEDPRSLGVPVSRPMCQ
jgi:hypothetical protein